MPSASDERTSQPLTAIFSSTRLRRPIALLALPLLFAAKSHSANDRNLCQEGFLQVLSPDALSITVGQCRAVVRQTMAAWTFDANQMRWADLREMEKPLTLRLLSLDRMKQEHPGLLGFARGRDLFVVSTAVLGDSFANGTLAHELAHIQAKRALGRFSEAHLRRATLSKAMATFSAAPTGIASASPSMTMTYARRGRSRGSPRTKHARFLPMTVTARPTQRRWTEWRPWASFSSSTCASGAIRLALRTSSPGWPESSNR